ncbi:hypothetical protein [Maridesulfovibrio sp.]|uniref:hypothetical protein n=1 Tax=Maridesulfovibrio sp. TaxID=2795000 RepID=UPI002A189C4F|nr:hypothetical protein [Maridesulfovibrio sp.]
MCNNDGIMKYSMSRLSIAAKLILILLLIMANGCAMMHGSLDQAQEYSRESNYEAAVQTLDNVIGSDESESVKAHAFMLRAEAYSSLKEYRSAYRDLQVAWKLSCHLYQKGPDAADAESDFNTAKSCTEKIPLLIDELKPFISDFGAIMATQEAAAIVRKIFPELPR